jgi:Arc/MetJ family transcription regulator
MPGTSGHTGYRRLTRVLCYTSVMAARSPVRTRSFRIDPKLVAAARRATGARDDTEAVRIALAELVERAQFQRWVRKVAGKGKLGGLDS